LTFGWARNSQKLAEAGMLGSYWEDMLKRIAEVYTQKRAPKLGPASK